MTVSYNPAQLATNTTYQVRFYIGDTDVAHAQLQDEEIAWAVSERGNVWGGTALCALALAAKYARLTSISADGVSQALNQKTTAFEAIAVIYTKKEAIYRAKPYLGGVSIRDMRAALSNTDRVPDIFRLAISDNPPNDGVAPVNEPAIGADDPVFDGGL